MAWRCRFLTQRDAPDALVDFHTRRAPVLKVHHRTFRQDVQPPLAAQIGPGADPDVAAAAPHEGADPLASGLA